MTKNNPDILCPSCHSFSERRFPRLWPVCECDWEMPEKSIDSTLDCTKKSCRCKTRKNKDEALERK